MARVVEGYPELARRILDRPARLGRTRLVAVDGPSGAGKTAFAGHLAAALGAAIGSTGGTATPEAAGAATGPGVAGAATGPGVAGAATGPGFAGAATGPGAGGAVPVVHTDDLLDGWADQFTFWPRLDEWVLAPLRAGLPGRYRRYDWRRGRFDRRWITVPPAPVVLLEGVSSARAAIAPELALAVFVTAPVRLRRDRALARDGADLLPQLTAWWRAERAHFAADGTAGRADLVVDGAAGPAHDDPVRYVRIR